MMAMACGLLKTKSLLGRFWGETVRHVVYILNRVATKALNDVAPYEAWLEKKPSPAHLWVFGCIAHVKVNTYSKKLDDRIRRMTYLGVELGSKAHCLFNPET